MTLTSLLNSMKGKHYLLCKKRARRCKLYKLFTERPQIKWTQFISKPDHEGWLMIWVILHFFHSK